MIWIFFSNLFRLLNPSETEETFSQENAVTAIKPCIPSLKFYTGSRDSREKVLPNKDGELGRGVARGKEAAGESGSLWREVFQQDNGGSEITNFIVEYRKPNQKGWSIVASDVTKRLIKANLLANNEYYFRVCAENKVGVGPTIETKTPILAINPIDRPGEPENLHIADKGKTFGEATAVRSPRATTRAAPTRQN